MAEVKFQVEIKETYKGSEWYWVHIVPSGFGNPPKKFFLISLDDVLDRVNGEELVEIIAECIKPWRPEYAKAIKKLLESEND